MDSTDQAADNRRVGSPATVAVGPVRPRSTAVGLLMACHPLPAVTVTLLVTVLAAAAGHNGPACLLLGAAVLSGQLSVGWCNDAVDAQRDRAAGRYGKPVVAGSVSTMALWSVALVALGLSVPLSLAPGVLAGTVHLVGVGAAWAYNLGLKATPLSWLPYAAGFAGLPAFVVLSLPGSPWPPWWMISAGALLGVGAHLGNVLPDIDSDLATGVRGWPQRLGRVRARRLLPVPLVAASAALTLGAPGPSAAAGLLALAVAALTAVGGAVVGRHRDQVPFIASIIVAGIDVALLMWQGVAIM